jgi:hypothetical protein
MRWPNNYNFTVMEHDKLVAMILLIRFALSFLWFVVECGQKGHCHGQLDEPQLPFYLLRATSLCPRLDWFGANTNLFVPH